METMGGREDRILKKRHLHRPTDVDLLNWNPTAAAAAAVAVDGGTMRSNDPNILPQCHFHTGTHSVSELTFTRQRVRGGAGGDADGSAATAEATYHRQRMQGSAKGGGGESATSESMVEQ